jgi:hypothetical protein
LKISEIVNVQFPPASAVTLIVVPETLVLTIPVHPDAVYGTGSTSVTVNVCVELSTALKVKVDGETVNGARVGLGSGVGVPLGAGPGDPLGVGLGAPLGLGVGRGSST